MIFGFYTCQIAEKMGVMSPANRMLGSDLRQRLAID